MARLKDRSNETYIIFEAGLNHNGSPDLARKLVEAAAHHGADAVKFQKRSITDLASREMLASEERRFPSLGSTYKEVRERLELDFKTYVDLRSLSHELALDFIITPFDEPSLDFVLEVGVDAIKIASHSVAHPRLLRKVSQVELPVFMSSGMVTQPELDAAVDTFSEAVNLTLLHCSSEYPTAHEGARLSLIPFFRERYGLPIGFSSHELGQLHSLAAVALGATALERHVTLDRSLEGFDHRMSMTTTEFGNMVADIRSLEVAMGEPEKVVTLEEQKTRDKYRVSMVASRDLDAGEALDEGMISYKNPGTGIPAIQEKVYLERILRRSVNQDDLLHPDDFE